MPEPETVMTPPVETKEPPRRVLTESDKLVIRCISCGHFLTEKVADSGQDKILCRQSECKTYNHITVHDKDTLTIRREKKRDVYKL